MQAHDLHRGNDIDSGQRSRFATGIQQCKQNEISPRKTQLLARHNIRWIGQVLPEVLEQIRERSGRTRR